MNALQTAPHVIGENDFLNWDLSIAAVNILDKRPSGNGTFTHSGKMKVELEDIDGASFEFEWIAYHKDCGQEYLKTDPKWSFLQGDWHIGHVSKDAEISITGFSLTDEDGNKLSEKEEKHFVLSVFHENYHWKTVVASTLGMTAT